MARQAVNSPAPSGRKLRRSGTRSADSEPTAQAAIQSGAAGRAAESTHSQPSSAAPSFRRASQPSGKRCGSGGTRLGMAGPLVDALDEQHAEAVAEHAAPDDAGAQEQKQ